jgi:16S rRNA G527 N7-methylase RsmG
MPDLGLVDLHDLTSRLIPPGRLDDYFNILMEQNRRVNLVSRETTRADFDRMVGESLLPLPQIKTPVEGYLDIGAGGGIPAVPILLTGGVPGRIVLVERTMKKARALTEILSKLGLTAEVIPKNFDELHDLPKFNLVTLRYVKLTSTLLEGATRLLRRGGSFVYYGPAEGVSSDQSTAVFTFQSSQDSAVKSITIFQK